ncbi:hypothetical protein FSP39_019058 [Pinctada imbricata]|uniref:Uncharacterized protein n=1 Tax=Pinctada imbricata TaxID=66713 RepID=A0AA88YV30_PINIB|nr:hypothetical protein FSP39_019058 [Pinctada imbricata]
MLQSQNKEKKLTVKLPPLAQFTLPQQEDVRMCLQILELKWQTNPRLAVRVVPRLLQHQQREGHIPCLKVTTPPPPRRALPPEIAQSSAQQAKSPPSPPPRNQNFELSKQMLINNKNMAPELPPRRNREHSKISSPSLSRKTNECVVSKLPTPVLMRQHEESPKSSPSISRKLDKPVSPTRTIITEPEEIDTSAVLVTTSPVLMRKTGRIEFINTSSPIPKRKFGQNGHVKLKEDHPPPVSKPSPILVRKIQAELKDSPRTAKKNYERAPTPPPRLARSNSKPESQDTGACSSQKIHPVFKVSTPTLPSKDNSGINSSLTKKMEKKGDKGDIPTQHKEVSNVKSSSDQSRYLNVSFRECEPMKCETERVVKREIKTLSMEIEEENMRNLMMEMRSKEGKSPKSSVATMNVLPGPVLVKECVIPPPERAVISGPAVIPPPVSNQCVVSGPPPPSPSSMDILEEEEEEVDDENVTGKSRMCKEVEEFGDSVCQRLSMLLESKDVVYDRDLQEDNVHMLTCTDAIEETTKRRSDPVSEDLNFESNSQGRIPDALKSPLNEYSSNEKTTEIAVNSEATEASYTYGNEFKFVGFDYRNYANELKPRKRSFHQYEVPLEFRDSYDPQKEGNECIENPPVQEDHIIPKEIKRKSLIENLQPLRGSDILCEIISAYSEPDVKQAPEVAQEVLVSHESVELRSELPTNEAKQPSRLDQSLQKIFKMPNTDETYKELLPLENFLEDVLDASPEAENYYPTFDSSDVLFVKRYRHIGGRQSMTRTESDIDFSEPGDDMSTGSMLADDEDEVGSGEILFSREYPDTRLEGEVTGHPQLQDKRSRERYDDDDNYWEEDDDEDYDYDRYSVEESEELSSEENEYYNDYIVEDQGAKKDEDDDLAHRENTIQDPEACQENVYVRTETIDKACPVSDYENDYSLDGASSLHQPPEPEVLLNPSCETELRHSPRDNLHFDFLTFQSHSTPDAGDLAYDSARRQMNEIHHHLQNLRDQMEQLAQECECEGHNLRPSLVLEADADVKHRRRSKDKTE